MKKLIATAALALTSITQATPIVSLDRVEVDINDTKSLSSLPLHVLAPDYWINWEFFSGQGAVGWANLAGNWNGPLGFSTGIDVDFTISTPVTFYVNGVFFPFSFTSMSARIESLETSSSAFSGTEHIILPVLQGTLMPGSYNFSLNGSGEATAWGGVTFATVATPDAGSTLILLSFALLCILSVKKP